MSQVTNTIPHFRNSGNVKMQYAQRENLAFQTNRAHLQYRRSSPEAPELSSSTGQHALKTTIGKMKTEGRPTRAPILTVVDRPIRIGFQMEKRFLSNKFVPRVRPALERLRQAGRIELIDGDFELYPGLELLKAGGHTPGSQIVALHTAAGKTVLCGDIACTCKIIRYQIPVGWNYKSADTLVILERRR